MSPRNDPNRSWNCIRTLALALALAVGTAHAADYVWQGTCGGTDWYATCIGTQCSENPDAWWVYNNWGGPNCGTSPPFPGATDDAYLASSPVLLTVATEVNYLAIPPGGRLTVSGVPAVFRPYAGLLNDGELVVMDGARLEAADCTISNAGILTLHYGGMSGFGKLTCNGTVSLTGTGSLAFVGGTINGTGTLVNGPSHTIRGANGSLSAALSNDGLVSVDVYNESLAVDGPAKTNQGTIEAKSGSYLDLYTPLTQTPTAEIRVAGTTSRIRLHNGAAITGGLLSTSDGGVFTCGVETATLTDVTNTGQIEFYDGATLNVTGTAFTNNGVLGIYYGGYLGGAHLRVADGVTLQGSGSVVLDNGSIDSTGTLGFTHAAGHTIHGAPGTIAAALTNHGVISTDLTGHSLVLSDKPKTNDGTIEAALGSYLDIYTTLTQSPAGEIRALGAGTAVRLHNGTSIVGGVLSTATGGVFTCAGSETATLADVSSSAQLNVVDGATLVIAGATLLNDDQIGLYYGGGAGCAHLRFDSHVTIDGNGSVWSECGDITTAAGVSVTNGPGHTLHGGGPFNVALLNEGAIIADHSAALSLNPQAPGVTNAGRLEVQPGRTLTINNASLFTQTAGESIANGTLVVNGAALDLQGGTLKGTGMVAGNVNNAAATVEPGTSAGILTITGDYTQATAGELDIQLGGLTAGSEHDRLVINGNATLAGELHVTTINDFEPAVGQQFVILTTSNRTGTFTAKTGTVSYDVIYNPTNVTIVIAPPPPCRGDTNCDGRIDFGDINAFIDALLYGVYCDGTGETADVNGDGTPDFGDINPYIALLTGNPLPILCP